MEFNSDAFSGVDDHILDTLSREFTCKILSRLLKQLKNKQIMNQIDHHGYALIHYLTFVNFHECIKLMGDFGADLNLMAKDGSNPLLIAVSKGHEASV